VAAPIHLGHWAANIEMKIPVTVIGFGLVVLGRAILGMMRASYLKQASRNVSIDYSKEIILRYAGWYYVYPVLCFGLSAFCAYDAFLNHNNQARSMIGAACSLFMIVGGIFLSYRQWTGRVRLFEKKLTYTEGSDRWEITANEVDSVMLNGFTFIIKKRSEKIVRVPATFEHSEIILAFLNQAAVNK
jgi:hypothetical protein